MCYAKEAVSQTHSLKLYIRFVRVIVFVKLESLNLNLFQFAIECKELVPNASWFEVPSGDCIPFWPVNPETQKLMVARIKGTMLETLPFRITESHTTFLQLYHDVIE